MEFIKYPLPDIGEEVQGKTILRNRRLDLGLTQQQVADGAKIQLQQYQRLESGERNIESASLRVALSVCAVLKLDPFVFFPDCLIKNKYADSAERMKAPMMKEDAIELLLAHACELFNEHLHTNYSLDNIMVAYCTMDNIVEVYHTFTQQYGFHSENRTMADFETMLAEAFVGQTDIDDPTHVDGILIRTDPPADIDDPEAYMMLLVHELAHIFCATHEIETAGKAGQRFYDLYCAGEPNTSAERIADGQMNAGYAIWREFSAEIIQDIVYQQPSKHLREIAPVLQILAGEVKVGNTAAKSALHRYLSEIMNSWEGGGAETWEELEPKLEELGLPFLRIVHQVFDMLHDGNCFTIDPDSIECLGAMYLVDMIQNTPVEDIIKHTTAYGYKFM